MSEEKQPASNLAQQVSAIEACSKLEDNKKQVCSATQRQLNDSNQGEKMRIIEPLIETEGSIPYLYCDTSNTEGGTKVTVGVGFMIPTENAIKELSFHKSEKDFTPASDEEKVAAFNKILGQGDTPGSKTYDTTCAAQTARKNKDRYTAEKYSQTTTLRLTPESQAKLLIDKVLAAEKDLKKIFDKYDKFPMEAKTALVDMHYNLGPGRYKTDTEKATGFRQYGELIKAVKASDWEKAAKECRRNVESEASNSGIKKRNDDTEKLFNDAAKAKK